VADKADSDDGTRLAWHWSERSVPYPMGGYGYGTGRPSTRHDESGRVACGCNALETCGLARNLAGAHPVLPRANCALSRIQIPATHREIALLHTASPPRHRRTGARRLTALLGPALTLQRLAMRCSDDATSTCVTSL